MVARNSNIAKLPGGYLFPEINRRKKACQEKNPDAKIISLGVGNTTEPLMRHITEGLAKAAAGLGTGKGYSGYGDEQGFDALRGAIADKLYKGIVDPDEVLASDGAKCDIGRLQLLFGADASVAVQDPSYPVYVDGSVIIGASGAFDETTKQFDGIHYMPCLPENQFFPDLKALPRTDLIYFCSPNNPTGAVATRTQLKSLVDFALANRSIIIFDSAYSEYISDPELPRSIFEIEGARQCAIEVSSFSKPVGFTGLRLGWTVCPKELTFDDGSPVLKDWNRIMTTVFNGASNLVQRGGLAALDDLGLDEMQKTVSFYMENAAIIKQCLGDMGIELYGGTNAPYIWTRFPGQKSWDVFERILEEAFVVTTPGSGFGPAGEGFVRFSAFGHRDEVIEATKRLQELKI
ncbi:MAG: LL-diaminopimelate aminotransferase [Victivallales bacterium]|nr:LL-diaminopimelate aminotransferase [Victivallales bacterium]